MGNLLTAISGKFAKMIILGTMFPVVIMSVLNILLVAPLLSLTQSFPDHLAKIATGEEKWPAVMLSLVVFVLTGLLYDLNIPIIRIYEGYPWQNSLFGKSLLRLQRRRLAKSSSLAAYINPLRAQMRGVDLNGALLADLEGQDSALGRFLNSQLPNKDSLLLPTRLGNVIRSFEVYPTQAYGMDAIFLWPRLISKIDPAFASTIDEAKTAFDFMLNMSFLSAITAVGILTIGLAVPAPLHWTFVLPWFWRGLLFTVLAATFYYFSVNRAEDWGLQVKSAFDLYRFPLLEALGYKQKPLTFQEERALWSGISAQLLFTNDINEFLPYEAAPTRVIPYPADIKLVVRRHYDTQQPNLRIPVVIELENPDLERRLITLTIIDTLPDGYKYVPDSVSLRSDVTDVNDIGIETSRLAPPEFFLGPIPPGATLTLSYTMKPTNP